MIQITYADGFEKSVLALPLPTQRKLSRLIPILAESPFDVRLHTKKLGGRLADQFSFRITRDWRVIFKFVGDLQTVQLLRAKHRKDAYR
jgi:mRNA-degrading endonuclease RelE of RelBE toxin-antitoxin system